MSDSASVRSRKNAGEGSLNGANHSKQGQSSRRASDNMLRPSVFTRRSTIVVILLTISLIFWASLSGSPVMPNHSVNWWDENFHLRFGLQRQVYAVVIDAGSTGSRVSGFAFHQAIKGNSNKCDAYIFERERERVVEE